MTSSFFSSQSTHSSQDNAVLENQLPMFDAIEEYHTTTAEQSVAEYKTTYTLQLSLFGNTHELLTTEQTQQAPRSLAQPTLAQPTMKERKRIHRPSSEVYSAQTPEDNTIADDADNLSTMPVDSTDIADSSVLAIESPIDELDAQALQEIDAHELPADVLQELQDLGSELPDELRKQFFNPPAPVATPDNPTVKPAKPLSRRTLLRRIATEIGVATWFDDETEGWMWEDEISGKIAFRPVRNEEKALEEALTEVIQNSYPYLSDNDVELVLADPANYKDILQKAKASSVTKKPALGDLL